MNIFKKIIWKRQKSPPVIPANLELVNPIFANPIAYNVVAYNPIVYRCIKLIAQNIAGIPIVIPDEGIVRQILLRPNHQEDWQQIMEKLVSNLMVHGRTYMQFIGDDSVHILDQNLVKVERNEFGIDVGFSYNTIQGRQFEYIQQDGHCNILQIKYYDPFNKNLSPCSIVQKAVNLYNSITVSNQALMDNSARFSGALIINGNNIDESDIEHIRKSIDDKVGCGQAGRAIILQGDMRWEQMKINATDCDYTNVQTFVAREIMQGLGVPPIMLGLADTGFQHYKEARLHFWEDTLLPLSKYIWGSIAKWLSKCLQEEVVFKLDLHEIPAFADKMHQKIQIIANAPFLSDKEKRDFCGLS